MFSNLDRLFREVFHDVEHTDISAHDAAKETERENAEILQEKGLSAARRLVFRPAGGAVN